ncbi:MAG: hypothetical protein Q6K99_11000 [Thermostichales cyanobacterium BF4_bins_65]
MQPLPQPRSDKSLSQRYLNVCQAYLRLNRAYASLDLTHAALQSKFLHLYEQFQHLQASQAAVQEELESLRTENQRLQAELDTTRQEAAAYQKQMETKLEHLQACYQGVVVLLEQFELLLHSDSLQVLQEAEAAVAADAEMLAEVPPEPEPITTYAEQVFFSNPQQRRAAMNATLAQLDADLTQDRNNQRTETLALTP